MIHRVLCIVLLLMLAGAMAHAQPDTSNQDTGYRKTPTPAPHKAPAPRVTAESPREVKWIMMNDTNGFPSFQRTDEEFVDFLPYAISNNPQNHLWHQYPGIPGVNGPVYAIAVSGDWAYIGGHFSTAGGVGANNIVRWNMETNEWLSLGVGVNSPVYAIAIVRDSVYVGGAFIHAGNKNALYVAKWDARAHTWSDVGYGMDHWVYSLAVDSAGTLFAGGLFTLAGRESANHIAEWNGTKWSPVGGGTDKWVYALALHGNYLYAGGGFQTVGTTWGDHIAEYNRKTRMWENMGLGVDDAVYALAIDSLGDVYAGGQFNSADGVYANNIAKWNCSNRTWSGLPVGVLQSPAIPVFVSSIAVDDKYTYVGGRFYTTDSTNAYGNFFSAWDNNRWTKFGDGVNGEVFTVVPTVHGVLMGGRFGMAGAHRAYGIAQVLTRDASK